MIREYCNLVVVDTEAEIPPVAAVGGHRQFVIALDTGRRVHAQGGNWVDVTTIIGGPLPLVPDGSGNLVYTFPDGIPGYTNGFPILDPSWTWNVRFSFADTGTYTTTAELVDGVTKVAIAPPVTASIATVVIDAVPPTDIQLVLAGPAESVTVGTPTEYVSTMLADPSLHTGETFFVKVNIAKAGGTHPLTIADLSDVWVVANVPEKDVRFIRPKDRVHVMVPAYPHGLFSGTVTYISDVPTHRPGRCASVSPCSIPIGP